MGCSLELSNKLWAGRRAALPRALCFGLALLAAGCVTPQGSAVGEGAASAPAAKVTQQAARPVAPAMSPGFSAPGFSAEVTPAGLTPLPELRGLRYSAPTPARPRPAIIRGKRPLQCVPYARELSKIALRGNAWTWWKKAEGRYERGSTPRPGAVLVLSKTRRLRYGHLAVVAEVRNSREIIVHQANWLNRGRIHRYTPVRDISKNNDWSVVRVWYTPGHQMGSGRYPAYGFIYPDAGETPELRQASN